MKFVTSAVALAVLLAYSAFAQEKPIEFRLIAADTNPVGCRALDPALSRVHTVTKTGNTATIKSSVGIDDTMKEKTPNVYTTVFSLSGDIVTVLARGNQAAGEHTTSWDGKNRSGAVVARGVYFIRVVGPGFDETRKVLVVR